MPMGASVWMAWATTPASAPCSMRVCGIRCLWGGEGPFLWAEVLGPCFSVCKRFLLSQPPGAQWGQLLSCLYLVLSPGRACEQLVDFCSPDLNPCQHDGQCVGTPDGPRSVLPISRAREGRGCQVSSPPPSSFLPYFLTCPVGLVSAMQGSCESV